MRAVSLASSQRFRSIDADVQCKWTLTLGVKGPLLSHGLFTLATAWTVAIVIAWSTVIGGSSP